MNFLGQSFEQLEHYRQTDRQTDRRRDATKNTITPHSRAVIIFCMQSTLSDRVYFISKRRIIRASRGIEYHLPASGHAAAAASAQQRMTREWCRSAQLTVRGTDVA